MHIGNKISQCRRAAGISQEKLAEQLGISRQAVSRWETGEAVPDVEKVILLSRIFGVSTDYLLLDELEEAIAPGSAPAVPCGETLSTAVLERRRRFRIAFGLSLLILGLLTAVAALILAAIWASHATEWLTAYGQFGTGLLKTWRLALLVIGIIMAIAGGFVLAWEYRRTD
ncbi:MAG: helix-turn-helix transcriptional regulator [Clostridia bacterium]|nr:helix-turn-helix transcriptional regulator [Clostridia bacterium]